MNAVVMAKHDLARLKERDRHHEVDDLLQADELRSEGHGDQRAAEADGRLNRIGGDDDEREEDECELEIQGGPPVRSFLQGLAAFVQVGVLGPTVAGISA